MSTTFEPSLGPSPLEIDVRSRSRLGFLLQFRPRGFLETFGLVVLVVMLVSIVLLPPLLGLNPIAQNIPEQLRPPGPEHPFGTDNLGRDMLARVLIGGQVSVLMGVLVVILAGTFGILIGAIAGFFAGFVDEALMRIADVFLAFPTIMLALVIAGALGPSLQNGAIAIAVAWWPAYARIVRGQVIVVRDRDFIVASRTLGAGPLRILVRSVLPNSLGVLKTIFVLDVGYAILAASTLSFFGLGVQAPDPEWGLLIQASRSHAASWWLFWFPALAIGLFVASLNLAGGVLQRSIHETPAR